MKATRLILALGLLISAFVPATANADCSYWQCTSNESSTTCYIFYCQRLPCDNVTFAMDCKVTCDGGPSNCWCDYIGYCYDI